MLAKQNLLSLSGVLSLVWTLQLAFLGKLNFDANIGVLTSREKDRLKLRLRSLRTHIWQRCAVCLFCFVAMWVITAYELPKNDMRFSAAAGFLIGVGLFYLIGTVLIYMESADFIDKIKHRESIEKKRAEVVKSMDSK
ncbi:MAG: hypothetical protein AAGU75_21870 [Bacillota bacterium]